MKQYGDVLYRWNLLGKRAEVIKFLSEPQQPHNGVGKWENLGKEAWLCRVHWKSFQSSYLRCVFVRGAFFPWINAFCADETKGTWVHGTLLSSADKLTRRCHSSLRTVECASSSCDTCCHKTLRDFFISRREGAWRLQGASRLQYILIRCKKTSLALQWLRSWVVWVR